MIIVAKDGTGDYSSIQAAVDAACGEPVHIFVRAGSSHPRPKTMRSIGEANEGSVSPVGCPAQQEAP